MPADIVVVKKALILLVEHEKGAIQALTDKLIANQVRKRPIDNSISQEILERGVRMERAQRLLHELP